MTIKPDWALHCETREENPSKHPWGDPSDVCLIVQKKVNTLNDRLMAKRQTKYTYAPDGCLPIPKEQ